jgi:hypothetical protein
MVDLERTQLCFRRVKISGTHAGGSGFDETALASRPDSVAFLGLQLRGLV